jgi:hypothetical protein
MRTRHRHRSEEITFDLKVKGVIQQSYGHPATGSFEYTRPNVMGSVAQTSQCPLHARFLDPVFPLFPT